jgi:hypothetical protein
MMGTNAAASNFNSLAKTAIVTVHEPVARNDGRALPDIGVKKSLHSCGWYIPLNVESVSPCLPRIKWRQVWRDRRAIDFRKEGLYSGTSCRGGRVAEVHGNRTHPGRF